MRGPRMISTGLGGQHDTHSCSGSALVIMDSRDQDTSAIEGGGRTGDSQQRDQVDPFLLLLLPFVHSDVGTGPVRSRQMQDLVLA